MSALKNYIRSKKSLRQSWAYTDQHPLTVRTHAVGGAILRGLSLKQGLGIAAGTAATVGGGIYGYNSMEDSVETGDVRIRIDDDNAWWSGGGRPTLQIELAKGVGTGPMSGGDLISLGNSYSMELVSPQPAYMLRKALGLRQATAGDNVSYSVDPEQLAIVLKSLGNGIYADAKDAMIVELEVIPALMQIADVLQKEKDFSGGTYIVQRGDTLPIIADKTGVSLDQIIALNPEFQGRSMSVTPGMQIIIGDVTESGESDFETDSEVNPRTGAGQFIEDKRNKYVDFNTGRLEKKATRNSSKAKDLRNRIKTESNPRKKRRMSNRATRAEARAKKAEYKSKNLK